MCQSIIHEAANARLHRIDFKQPNSKLPILTREPANVGWVCWGRNRLDVVSSLPPGGWARLLDIKNGSWDRFKPKPVCILVASFMEMDSLGNTTWYPLAKGQFIQGVLAQADEEQRVYVVTTEPRGSFSKHERWPRIIINYRL